MPEQYPASPVFARVAAVEAIWRRLGAQLTHEAAAKASREADITLLEEVIASEVHLDMLASPEKEWKESLHNWLEIPGSHDLQRPPTLLRDVTVVGYQERGDDLYAKVRTSAEKSALYLVPMSTITNISVIGHDASDLR